MMISLSLCGIEFCGSDVGGFYGDPSMELLTRWYQLSSVQPFFRAHSHIESKRREPYLIEEPYGSVIKYDPHDLIQILDCSIIIGHFLVSLPIIKIDFKNRL